MSQDTPTNECPTVMIDNKEDQRDKNKRKKTVSTQLLDVEKPSIPIAYLAVILIWSTTPLAIVWSSETVSPITAALLRMGIAALLGTLILGFFSIPLPWHTSALRSYAYAVIGIYGAMVLTYLAAPKVSSGLISLLFGLSPMMSGLLSRFFLQGSAFSPMRWAALSLSSMGLGLVLADDLIVDSDAVEGILLLLMAVFLFSISGVLVKGAAKSIHPMAQAVGALWLSLPLYILSWWYLDGQLPSIYPMDHSLWAIVYLGICGSLLGFVSYFHILNHLTPTTVALITLITPVIAIVLGNYFNQEPITQALFQGTLLIILGLAVYHWGDNILHKSRDYKNQGYKRLTRVLGVKG